MPTSEHRRLREIRGDIFGWRRWGPYLSDRSWATVREDYSDSGDPWRFLPHDLARSKAYRWGEDGIAGICDRFQVLCFAPAFWNGADPILKERLFGVTPVHGNHGEDAKEYYYYLDSTPTHSYMKFLYKYPQRAFPYERLETENARRDRHAVEYELLDTGVFDDDRYFDIFVEYAKANVEDMCIRITCWNRGPDPAPVHILPHLWFRNTWAWSPVEQPRPNIEAGPTGDGFVSVVAHDRGMPPLPTVPVDYRLGPRTLYAPASSELLFTDNETNAERVFGPGNTSKSRYVKDAFHRQVVHGEQAVCPERCGTKAAMHFTCMVPPRECVTLRLRLSDSPTLERPLREVDAIIAQRQAEADEFYASVHPPTASADERLIQRQAFAGLLWSKQNYIFDVDKWLNGDFPELPPPASRQHFRNRHWRHLNSLRVMSMPDKWEYPWFAAWDLAFQAVAFALIDPEFAKNQLWVLLFDQFQHPNGQIPAYEWEFSDLNPPVHAWAVWRVFHIERLKFGQPDRPFLERCFHKLLMNFSWWINNVDSEGNNIFEGGFLGLDNITVIDRSIPFSERAVLEQADGTGWMGMFCLNMMRIALELAKENPAYETLAAKFFQHYTYVAGAMKHMGGRDYQLWDERDGFFYDVLRYADGRFRKFRVRSMVGLIPLFAVERLEEDWIKPFRDFDQCVKWFLHNRRDLTRHVIHPILRDGKSAHALTIVNTEQLGRILERLLDETEFLSRYGIRSLSKYHQEHPFEFDGRVVGYEPGEAVSNVKGGNSNWRGPIWFPACFLLIESLAKLTKAFGPKDGFTVPSQGGRFLTFTQMAEIIANRLIAIFARDANGKRPVFGDAEKFQNDPHWRDHLLFYEYFHGDTGAGLGASHQTGWTALVAVLIDEWRNPRT